MHEDGADGEGLDLFLAEWVRGRLGPADAVERAIDALEAGCGHYSVAVVAGLCVAHPSVDDIEPELDRLLQDLGKARPSPSVALKVLVDDCARRIADRRTEPIRGAWEMFDFWVNEDESVEFLDQVRRFVDLVCDWDNAGRRDPAPSEEIIAEARAFIDRGGLAPLPSGRD